MAEQPSPHHQHEPHAWADLLPDEVLAALVYELYSPVSTLGSQVDRLSSGAFADEELPDILRQLRDATNQLGRVVVSLKRYVADRPPPETP